MNVWVKHSAWIGPVVGALLVPFAYAIMRLAPNESVLQTVLYPVWYIVMFPAVFFPPPHGIAMAAAIAIFWIVVGALPGLTIWIIRHFAHADPKT
jgi:hypothetical protein